MKVRLWRGPFDGKVYKDWRGGDIVVEGEKKMSKRERSEWYFKNSSMYSPPMLNMLPRVRAIYSQAFVLVREGDQIRRIPAMHPDGSYFYECKSSSKR